MLTEIWFCLKAMCFSSCALHTPFKRTESIKCTIMGIRTSLVHDSPLSVYCLMPQIKFYLWKMSVGDLRRLLFWGIFFVWLVFLHYLLYFSHNLLGVWDLYLKIRWFDKSGLRSSSLCFTSQEVYSTEF